MGKSSPRPLPPGQLLYQGETPIPELLQLATAFSQTNAARWISGVLPVSNEELTLFFLDDKENAHVAKYPYSSSSLETLASACQKASFGQGHKEVLDESYRKAGMLDFGKFCWVKRLDELDAIVKNGLLPFEGDEKQDRARSSNRTRILLVATGCSALVFVLPSPHTGGELILKHSDEEYVFDAGSLLMNNTNSLAYVAFYSDVDHEVREVTDGHRITITYNLYTVRSDIIEAADAHTSVIKTIPCINIPESPFLRTLTSLLSSSQFLPEGGLLGFALQHLYPLPADEPFNLSEFSPQLKGIDAAVAHACQKLDLKHDLRVVYIDNGHIMLTDCVLRFDEFFDDSSVFTKLISDNNGAYGEVTLVHYEKDAYSDENDKFADQVVPVHWISRPESYLAHEQHLASYGNEPSVEHVYAHFAIIVGVGKADDRTGYGEIPPFTDDSD